MVVWVKMDITLLSNNSLKIKDKKATVVIDPQKETPKISADCVILTSKDAEPSRVTDSRVLIEGAGEYEVGGLKITGINFGDKTAYVLTSDRTEAFLAKASTVENTTEKIRDYPVAILNADSGLNQTVITALEPRLLILYGEKAKEGAKVLGKENVSIVSKYSFSEDKLSEEMEVVVLG